MMRMGVRNLLAMDPRIEVVGEVSDGLQAITQTAKFVPDIVIMDISLPVVKGLEATMKILQEHPCVRVILLSMYEDKEYVSQFLKSGASAYVLKHNPPSELLSAIDAASRGEAYFSPSIAQIVLQEYTRATTKLPNDLTIREQEALILLAQGLSSKQIAGKMYVSIRTVAKYRESIMQKLNLHSVAELTQYAIAKKLIEIGSV